ncbi:MAG: DMT family transporter [Nocardioidaceae bacterium]
MLVILLGLLAAFLFAAAAFLQQQGARATVAEHGRGDRHASIVTTIAPLMGRLVRNRVWLSGWSTNLTGFLTQGAALHLGSVVVVQPLLSTQLLFALPMSSLRQRRWPAARDWWSVLSICGGLVSLFAVEGIAPLGGRPDRPRIAVAVLSAMVLVGVLVLAGTRCRLQVSSVLVAVGAGVCFAMTAVFMTLTAEDLVTRGVAATAVDWPGYCLAASTLTGLLLEQAAFAGGPLSWSLAAMNVTNPVVSYGVGVFAFQARMAGDLLSLAGIGVAGTLIALGVVGLAHSPTARASWVGQARTLERMPDGPRPGETGPRTTTTRPQDSDGD